MKNNKVKSKSNLYFFYFYISDILLYLLMIRAFVKHLSHANQQFGLNFLLKKNVPSFRFSNSKRLQELLSQITVQTNDNKTLSIL